MVSNICIDSFNIEKLAERYDILLHWASWVCKRFADNDNGSICGPNVHLPYDKVIQATCGTICGNNKKNIYSGIEHCILPSWYKCWSSVGNNFSVNSNNLLVYEQHNKRVETCNKINKITRLIITDRA